MKSIKKAIVKMTILSALSVMPLAAQIRDGVDFKTSFPFYAGNATMPAGSYKLTRADFDANVLLIESTDGSNHSAFIDFQPTQAEQRHVQSDVTFHKYGNTEYLNRIWVEGETYGMKVEPTKAEQKAASVSTLEEHSLTASKR